MRRALWLILAPVFLLASCSTSCRDPKPEPSPANPVTGAEINTRDPAWVSQHSPRAQVALVFVHGIFGDTFGTWTHSPQTSFFTLLNSDAKLGAAVDMFAFGYTSKMLGEGSFTIDEAARRLRERLEYNGILEYPAIVFVAHSMGGLVTLRTLLTYRDLLPRVPLIALYSTPQEGAQIAEIAQNISPNLALRQMIPGDANLYLEALDNDWKEATRTNPIPVVCAYDKLNTYQIKIVPRGSATRYCTEPSSAIDANHMTITKPDRPGHDSIVMLVNALNRYVTGQQWTAKMELPDFRREGDRWLFTLNGEYGKQHAQLVNAGRRPLRYMIAELSDPGLYVWPEDTPRTVIGGAREQLGFALARNATKTEYDFLIRSDGLPDERVRVRVEDLPDQLRQQAALTNGIIAEISTQLGTSGEREKLLAATDPALATDAVLERARLATARVIPDAPASIQWVMTADALNAVNLSTLAVGALRKAEQASPAVVQLPGVTRTASWVATSAGETHLFEKAATPMVPASWRIPLNTSLPASVNLAAVTELVSRCQGISALAGSCLSLQGDVAASRGDTKAATEAFEAAARIRMTPTLTERLRIQKLGLNSNVINRDAVVVAPVQTPAPPNPRAVVPR